MNSKSKNPLYITIMEVLKERIIAGVYGLHSLMPTEIELEKEFQVSKITIRKAIELLEKDGFVEKRSGFGTKVISNGLYNVLLRNSSFSRILASEGYTFRREKTRVTKIQLTVQDELYPIFQQDCFKITRIYYLDGQPFIYYTHYLPGSMKLDEVVDDERYSIYMQMYKNNMMIAQFVDEFYIDYPPSFILEELKLKEGPLMGRKRTTLDAANNVLEISYSQYNTRLHPYTLKFDV